MRSRLARLSCRKIIRGGVNDYLFPIIESAAMGDKKPPILGAAAIGDAEEVQCLLNSGTDADDIESLDTTVLMVAAWKDHAMVVDALIAAGRVAEN